MEYFFKTLLILGIAFVTYQYVDYALPQELPPIVFELETDERWVRCSKPEYCYRHMEMLRDAYEDAYPSSDQEESRFVFGPTAEIQMPLKGEGQRGRSCLPY